MIWSLPTVALVLCQPLLVPQDDVGEGAGDGTVAHMVRLADPVAFLDGQSRSEEMLFYWDKTRYLRPGDGLRQGAAGMAEIVFMRDLSSVRLFGEAHVIVKLGSEGGPVIQVLDINQGIFELGGNGLAETPATTTVELPGGTTIRCGRSWYRVVKDELNSSYRIRNAGPGEVSIEGPVTPVGASTLTAGEEVRIPILQKAGLAVPVDTDENTEDRWEGYQVHLEPGIMSTKTDDELVLEGVGAARVGGARIYLPDEGRIRIWRPER